MLALFALEQTEDVNALFFAAAERLLEEDLPNRADLPYGCAGIGAALVTNTGMEYYRSAFPGLQYYNLAEETLGRSVYLIYRKNQFIDPPMQYLIHLLSKKEQIV